MAESSLMRISKRNKDIIQAMKLYKGETSEDRIIDMLIAHWEPTEIKEALECAIKEKARWLHEIKDEIQ